MKSNIKNLKKVTLEEQKQIEEAFEKICDCIATSALNLANNGSYSIDATIKEIKKLNDLLNEFLNNRIFLTLKRTNINIENLESKILKDTVVKTLNANPTSECIEFFKSPLNIGYLKLLGKKELLNKQGITVVPLENLLKSIEDEINKDIMSEIEINHAETISIYLYLFSNRIANRKLIINYVDSYGKDLAKVLTEKYLLVYENAISKMQSKIKNGTVTVKNSALLNKDSLIQAQMAYGLIGHRVWFILPFLLCHCNNGICSFEMSTSFDLKDQVYTLLNDFLNIPTFAAILGKEPLSEEEIKAIEEKTNNHEIKNYDEASAILLGLRKKEK